MEAVLSSNDVSKLYLEQGLSVRELASHYETTQKQIKEFMSEHNIPLRIIDGKPKKDNTMPTQADQLDRPTTTRGKAIQSLEERPQREIQGIINDIQDIANSVADEVKRLQSGKNADAEMAQKIDSDLRERKFHNISKKELAKKKLEWLKMSEMDAENDIAQKTSEYQIAMFQLRMINTVKPVYEMAIRLLSEVSNVKKDTREIMDVIYEEALKLKQKD